MRRGKLDEIEGPLLRDHVFDKVALVEPDGRLADRSVLLIGPWNDLNPPVEQHLFPLYRALREFEDADVTALAYPDGHFRRSQRERIADDIVEWLRPRLEYR